MFSLMIRESLADHLTRQLRYVENYFVLSMLTVAPPTFAINILIAVGHQQYAIRTDVDPGRAFWNSSLPGSEWKQIGQRFNRPYHKGMFKPVNLIKLLSLNRV